jgi:hypothetical protein
MLSPLKQHDVARATSRRPRTFAVVANRAETLKKQAGEVRTTGTTVA